MKTITISVKVSGGIPPFPIMVDITNLDTKQNLKFESRRSFSNDFDLDSGKCTIIVSGMNPEKGKTEIVIAGEFTEGPYPNPKKTTEKTFFSELFFCTT